MINLGHENNPDVLLRASRLHVQITAFDNQTRDTFIDHCTITVISNTIEGIPQGGVELRQTGSPVAVRVAVPLVKAIYLSFAPTTMAGIGRGSPSKW